MSTILSSSSQLAPLSARRRWCWARTGPLQESGDSKQVGGFIHCLNDQGALFSIPWESSKICPLPHPTPRRTLRKRSSKAKKMASPDPQKSFDIRLLPPGSHCHLLKETQEQHQCPTTHPSPSVFLGKHFPVCSLHVRLVCWGGPQWPCSQKFSSLLCWAGVNQNLFQQLLWEVTSLVVMGFPLQVSYEPFKLKNNWISLLPGTFNTHRLRKEGWLEKPSSHLAYGGKEHVLLLLNEYEFLCSRRNGLFASKALYTNRHIANTCIMVRDGTVKLRWLFLHWQIRSVSCCNIFSPREQRIPEPLNAAVV